MTNSIDHEWIKFVKRMQGIIAKRGPNAPVCMIVCYEISEASHTVNFVSSDLQDHHRVPIIGEMIEALALRRPDMPECLELRDAFRRIMQTTGDVQDVSKGLS